MDHFRRGQSLDTNVPTASTITSATTITSDTTVSNITTVSLVILSQFRVSKTCEPPQARLGIFLDY